MSLGNYNDLGVTMHYVDQQWGSVCSYVPTEKELEDAHFGVEHLPSTPNFNRDTCY